MTEAWGGLDTTPPLLGTDILNCIVFVGMVFCQPSVLKSIYKYNRKHKNSLPLPPGIPKCPIGAQKSPQWRTTAGHGDRMWSWILFPVPQTQEQTKSFLWTGLNTWEPSKPPVHLQAVLLECSFLCPPSSTGCLSPPTHPHLFLFFLLSWSVI